MKSSSRRARRISEYRILLGENEPEDPKEASVRIRKEKERLRVQKKRQESQYKEGESENNRERKAAMKSCDSVDR